MISLRNIKLNKFQKILLLVFIFFLLMMGKKAFGLTAGLMERPLHETDYRYYCRAHNLKYAGKLEYEERGEYTDLEPMAAYCMWKLQHGKATRNEMEAAIWHSVHVYGNGNNSFSDEFGTDVGVDEDTQRYADVFYGVLKPYMESGEKSLFKLVNEDPEKVHVLVDQKQNLYTVGPYKIQLNPNIPTNDATEAGKDGLYKDLLDPDKYMKEKYIDFDATRDITNMPGEDKSYKLLDSNGQEIKFPDFKTGQEFYIQFKPKYEGRVDCTGFPKFTIHAIASWIGRNVAYDCIGMYVDCNQLEVDAHGAADSATAEVVSTNPAPGSHVSTAEVSGTMQVKITVTASSSVGSGTGTKTIDLAGKATCIPHYNTWTDEDGNEHEQIDYYIVPPASSWVATESKKDILIRGNFQKVFQPLVDISPVEPGPGDCDLHPGWVDFDTILNMNKYFNVQLGGTVFLDGQDKLGEYDGTYEASNAADGENGTTADLPFCGIQVQLYDNEEEDSPLATTTTDKAGKYRFYGHDGKDLDEYEDPDGNKIKWKEPLMNPLHKYYVVFTYNGELYEPTKFEKSISAKGGKSNAKETDEIRTEFNAKFETIKSAGKNDGSTENNYKGQEGENQAYGLQLRILAADGKYQTRDANASEEAKAIAGNDETPLLTFEDVWAEFLTQATHKGETYSQDPKQDDIKQQWTNSPDKQKVITWSKKDNKYSDQDSLVDSEGTNYATALDKIKGYDPDGSLIKFIKDCMITSSTKQEDKTYPFDTPDKVLYDINNVEKPENKSWKLGEQEYLYLYQLDSQYGDQSRYVDFGLKSRKLADIALQKDLYQVRTVVNGKCEIYNYNRKNVDADGSFTIRARASDALFNGNLVYKRPVDRSDYLANRAEDDLGLRVYATYRLTIKNRGAVDVSLDEIADNYDADNFVKYSENNDVIVDRDGNRLPNAYIGSDSKGTVLSEVTPTESQARGTAGKLITSGNDDNTQENENNFYHLNQIFIQNITNANGGDKLKASGDSKDMTAYVYVTFKVATDPNTARVRLDQKLADGTELRGKINIAEINQYTTYDDEGKKIGLIDRDSNPGSLSRNGENTTNDLYNDGSLKQGRIIVKDKDDPENRSEDDMDDAPSFRLIIDTTNDNERKVKGYTFEDDRTNSSGTGNVNGVSAVIGDGKYENNKDTKINGITLQLVQLVPVVDNTTHIQTNDYQKEQIVSTTDFQTLEAVKNQTPTFTYDRYKSGTNTSKIILQGPQGTILHVDADQLEENGGFYEFNSLVAGDYYVRFKYGDTADTALTNASDLTGKAYSSHAANSNDTEANIKEEAGEINSNYGATGLNAKSYNGQDYKSTVYQTGIDQSLTYNGINQYTNYGTYGVDDSGQNGYLYDIDSNKDSQGPGEHDVDKSKLFFYAIKSQDVKDISDAKDILDRRNQVDKNCKADNGTNMGVNGQQLNTESEILASFYRKNTYWKDVDSVQGLNASQAKQLQNNMINEFMNQTWMMATSGVMNLKTEKDTTNEDNAGIISIQIDEHQNEAEDINSNGTSQNSKQYVVDDLDLGLSERPKAELKIDKQVQNIRIALATGQVLFNTNKSVDNLSFGEHTEHKTSYDRGLMKINSLTRSNKTTPELINTYVDDELMEGAELEVKYAYKVINVGEADFTEAKFYYTGTGGVTPVKTSAKDVIDYVTNNTQYRKDLNEDNNWEVKDVNYFIKSAGQNGKTSEVKTDITQSKEDKVNNYYVDKLRGYSTLLSLSTDGEFNKELVPGTAENTADSAKTTLTTNSQISNNNGLDNLTYNNLTEIISTSNSVGRRMAYSIVGNQRMSEQNAGDDTSDDYLTRDDLVHADEVDASSAQKVVLMPPTGLNKNYTPIIVGLIIGAAILFVATVRIRRKLAAAERHQSKGKHRNTNKK